MKINMNIYSEDCCVAESITDYRLIAVNILNEAITNNFYMIHFELRDVLNLRFRKDGEAFLIDVKEKFNIKTLQDAENVCRELCLLFNTSLTEIYDVRCYNLKYILKNKHYNLRYSSLHCYPSGMDMFIGISTISDN